MSTKPVTELHIRAVANGLQVSTLADEEMRKGFAVSPDQLYVFATVQDFVEWAGRQVWQFAGDRPT